MLLTMAGLMVAIVWLSAHAQEHTLPPLTLPESESGRLGLSQNSPLHVTLRPGADGAVSVYLEAELLRGGIAALEAALEAQQGRTLTLRADAELRWDAVLQAMSAAARWGIEVNVAVER